MVWVVGVLLPVRVAVFDVPVSVLVADVEDVTVLDVLEAVKVVDTLLVWELDVVRVMLVEMVDDVLPVVLAVRELEIEVV